MVSSVFRLHVDEVNPEAVDLGRELREGVQSLCHPPEVILGRPVARQLLQHLPLHALGRILNELLAGPARHLDAPAKVVDRLLLEANSERLNARIVDDRDRIDRSRVLLHRSLLSESPLSSEPERAVVLRGEVRLHLRL